jgi:hypothetical protein
LDGRCEKNAQEGEGVLVVSGGDATPVLDAADAALDGVPFGIEGPVESGRTASL